MPVTSDITDAATRKYRPSAQLQRFSTGASPYLCSEITRIACSAYRSYESAHAAQDQPPLTLNALKQHAMLGRRPFRHCRARAETADIQDYITRHSA